MPWGIAASVAAPVVGGLVSSAMSPSASGGGPSYYTPTGLGQADTTWQQLLSSLNQNYNNAMPWIASTAGDALSNSLFGNRQYADPYMNYANQAGQQYANLANTLGQQSNLNYGTQQQLLGAGQDVYNLGRDPQNALYNRTLQQLQEQTGNTNSMYGLGSSAAGAGVANQALGNFNIDWQNQQLQRALQGLQGYNQAAQTAGGYGQLATGQAEAAPGYTAQAGALPWQVNQQLTTQPTQLLGSYANLLNAGVYQPGQNIQSSVIPYLNYGQGAQAPVYQNALQGAGALGSAVSQGIQGLGSMAQNSGGFSNLWGSNSPFGGSSGWSDYGGFGGSSPVTGLLGGGSNYSMGGGGAYGIY